MAIYPKRIVQKNSSDSIRDVRSQVDPSTGESPIVEGELVVQRGPGTAQIITLDADGNTVVVGGDVTADGIAPTLLLNFDGAESDTPYTYPSFESNTLGEPGKFGPKRYTCDPTFNSFAPASNTVLVDPADDDPIQRNPWTVQFWIRGDGATPAECFGNLRIPGDADPSFPYSYALIASRRNYPFGPGAFNIYLDAGTPDRGGPGSTTNKTEDVVPGAVVFGINLPAPYDYPATPAHGSADGLIPLEGNIVDSGIVGVLDGAWHHVAVSHEGDGSYAIWIDGVIAGRNIISGPINHDDAGLSGVVQPSGWSFGGSLVQNDLMDIPSGREFAGGIYSLDAFSMHIGVSIYKGLYDFEVPTVPPDATRIRIPVDSLQRLPDTQIPSDVADGSILVYDESQELWVTAAAPTYDLTDNDIGDLGGINLQDPAVIQDGERMVWDAANQYWTNRVPNLRDQFDIDFDNSAEGPMADGNQANFVFFDKAENRFKVQAPDWKDSSADLYQALDIEVPTDGFTAGQILVWRDEIAPDYTGDPDAAPAGFYPQDFFNQANLALDDLTDVDTTGASDPGDLDKFIGIFLQPGRQSVFDQEFQATVLSNQMLQQMVYDGEDQFAREPQAGDFLVFRDGKWVSELVTGLEADISNNNLTDLLDVELSTYFNKDRPGLPTDTEDPDRQDNRATFIDYQSLVFGAVPSDQNPDPAEDQFIGADLRYTYTGNYQGLTDYSLTIRPIVLPSLEASELQLHQDYAKLTAKDELRLKSYTNKIILQGPDEGDLGEDSPFPELTWRGYNRSYKTTLGDPPRTYDFTLKIPFGGLDEDVELAWPRSMASRGAVLMTDPTSDDFQPEQLVWYYPFEEFEVESLADVDFGDQTDDTRPDGSALVWNATEKTWYAGTVAADLANNSIGELTDVSIPSTFSTGQALVWTGNAWSPGKTLDVSIELNDLSELANVANTLPTNGQALVWNQVELRWEPGDVATDGGGAQYITELVDVDTTSEPPVQGQVLLWNGFSWVPGDQTGEGGGAAAGQPLSVAVSETATTGGATEADSFITLTALGGYGTVTRLEAENDVWISFYATAVARQADVDRVLGDPPATALEGFLGEATCNAGQTKLLTPPLQYFNGLETPVGEIYITLRRLNGAFGDVTVTIEGFGFGIFDAISGGTFGSG